MPSGVIEGVGMVQFTATMLLERPWAPEAGEVAATVARRFPTIGRVEPAPGADGRAAIRIDGAEVRLGAVAAPLPAERLAAPMQPMRAWDPEPAIRGHAAHLDISAGGALPGIEGAEAYAAAVHFVTAALVPLAPVTAIFWREGWAMTKPAAFAGAADDILAGRMPVGAWVSCAFVVPRGYEPGEATGAATQGMQPFLGRELELAPRPGDARSAWSCVGRVARMALGGGIRLADGVRLGEAGGAWQLTVRERDHWLRPRQPVFVLVADDSIIDPATLRPRAKAR
jgi:hypothetical protein